MYLAENVWLRNEKLLIVQDPYENDESISVNSTASSHMRKVK